MGALFSSPSASSAAAHESLCEESSVKGPDAHTDLTLGAFSALRTRSFTPHDLCLVSSRARPAPTGALQRASGRPRRSAASNCRPPNDVAPWLQCTRERHHFVSPLYPYRLPADPVWFDLLLVCRRGAHAGDAGGRLDVADADQMPTVQLFVPQPPTPPQMQQQQQRQPHTLAQSPMPRPARVCILGGVATRAHSLVGRVWESTRPLRPGPRHRAGPLQW